jgi:hypothetical protein
MEPEQMTDAEVVEAAARQVKTVMRNLRVLLHILKALEGRMGEQHES